MQQLMNWLRNMAETTGISPDLLSLLVAMFMLLLAVIVIAIVFAIYLEILEPFFHDRKTLNTLYEMKKDPTNNHYDYYCYVVKERGYSPAILDDLLERLEIYK